MTEDEKKKLVHVLAGFEIVISLLVEHLDGDALSKSEYVAALADLDTQMQSTPSKLGRFAVSRIRNRLLYSGKRAEFDRTDPQEIFDFLFSTQT